MNLAYVAGFFDGEGCVQFTKCRTSIYPRVLIVNTNRTILENIKEMFGGDIKPLTSRREGWKQGWQLRMSWSRAVSFLDKISPWVRIKQRQLHTVFAWNTIRPHSGGKWDRESLQLLTDRMTWLNAKGKPFGVDPVEIAMQKAGKSKK